MGFELHDNRKETGRDAAVRLPAVESFFDPDHLAAIWPESVATDESFVRQIRERKELDVRLDDVMSRLPRPDISVDEALRRGYVASEQVIGMFGSLSDLLEADPENGRIVLYLPFEFLSPIRSSEDEALHLASDRFRSAYLFAWRRMLSVHDVRANFVDGDVLEPEKRDGDLPRVVKAAHLIPKLVENGLLETEDVVRLMEGSEDRILRSSIADAFPVLADLGSVSDADIERMMTSSDRLIGNMARIMAADRGSAAYDRQEPASGLITYASIRDGLRDAFSDIEAETYGDATVRRIAWLKQQKKRDAVMAAGKEIGSAIPDGRLSEAAVAEFLSETSGIESRLALIEGIREAVESAASDDPEDAMSLYERYKEPLLTLWEADDRDVSEALSVAFCRLGRLGVVDDRQLMELGITVPRLSGPLSENLKTMGGELSKIRDMVASLEANGELSRMLFPIVLVYGSRLKGYGMRGADIDLGVFVRPGVSDGDRASLRESMKAVFPPETIRGEVVEFWLEGDGNGLRVRDFENRDVTVGDRSWAHVLFGAAWEGNTAAIREVREKLLTPYLSDVDATIHGRDVRGVYLEEMERDALQYRLMHKGYERFNPPFGGMHTAHADDIDGRSTYWDSGYRQLATRLFVERVFLPKLSKPE
jgi:hypothetical protein